jgi:hypothetical protein
LTSRSSPSAKSARAAMASPEAIRPFWPGPRRLCRDGASTLPHRSSSWSGMGSLPLPVPSGYDTPRSPSAPSPTTRAFSIDR